MIRERTLFKILHRGLPPLGFKLIKIIFRRLFICGIQPCLKLCGALRLLGIFHLRQINMSTLRQHTHCLKEGQILILHQESKYIAPLPTPKTIEHLLGRTDRKRGCLLIMERTAGHMAASLLCQVHIGTDHIHNIIFRTDLLHQFLGIIHSFLPFSLS